MKFCLTGIFSVCLLLSGCEVPVLCPDIYEPVCGSNSKTYSNSCNAKQSGIKRYFPGECPITKSGTILDKRSINADCGFVILVDQDEFHPTFLDPKFETNNLAVLVTYRRLQSYVYCNANTTLFQQIEVIKIDFN